MQIALGGITVLLQLPHLISTAHLVNALLILAGSSCCLAAPGRGAARAAPTDRLRRLARACGLIVLLVQLALGGYVRHSGPGSPARTSRSAAAICCHRSGWAVVHWVHRWLGVAPARASSSTWR